MVGCWEEHSPTSSILHLIFSLTAVFFTYLLELSFWVAVGTTVSFAAILSGA